MGLKFLSSFMTFYAYAVLIHILSEVKHFAVEQPEKVSANYILDPCEFKTDYNIKKIKQSVVSSL